MLLALAVTIHNIPEGLAVGVGFGAIGTVRHFFIFTRSAQAGGLRPCYDFSNDSFSVAHRSISPGVYERRNATDRHNPPPRHTRTHTHTHTHPRPPAHTHTHARAHTPARARTPASAH